MNREIKFRAWVDDDHMIYLDQVRGKYDFEDGHVVSFVVDNYEEFSAHERYSARQMELMQFTGREDADINGVEVYESDIIQNVDTGFLQIVYWNENEAAWYCRYVDDKNRIVSLADSLGNLNKVIGNIHENPKLLKPQP